MSTDALEYQQWREMQRLKPVLQRSIPETGFQSEGNGSIPESSGQSAVGSEISTADAAPYPSSFNHIVELITSGAPIPGIKEIPDTILEGQASDSTKLVRRKPWEKAPAEEVKTKHA